MSKRALAAAGLSAAVFALAATAWAQGASRTFTDPQNRFTFQYPANLDVDSPPARPDRPLNILVGLADYECQMFAVDRAEHRSSAPDAVVRAYSTALATDKWKASADAFALYNRQGTVQSSTIDTSKFWPVHRAELRTEDGKPAIGAMHVRPGVELWQFCTSFDGKDHSAAFNQMISSVAGPNDAALQAAAEAAAASRTAAQAAAAEAAAKAAEAAKAAPKAAQRPSAGRGRKKD
jgi:hypothetical protein